MESQQHQKIQKFIKKAQHSLTTQIKSAHFQDFKASILDVQEIQEASIRLKNGRLVAFPTETVYGLGADARNPQALKMIYATKKRPLTDPIIVHVLNAQQAEKLVILSEKQRHLFQLLTKQFWPGPLTIILKANLEELPLIVTAQTGFVGIRAPKHPYARKLIEVSGLPIGAPSANLFSHVSPTEPVHVFNDFFNCQVTIVDGGRCEFGVESTVLKLLDTQIQIFREGSLSVSKLQSYLKSVLTPNQLPPINILRKVVSKNINMEAPGQLLKHYAPYLPCYAYFGTNEVKQFENKSNNHRFKLQSAAFISFDKQSYTKLRQSCKHYFQVGTCLPQQEQIQEEQLFCSKGEKLRMRQIYYLLRHCENLNVEGIIVGWSGAREGTVWDKILRSTQGLEVEPTE